ILSRVGGLPPAVQPPSPGTKSPVAANVEDSKLVEATEKRLLTDDTLTPPRPDAPETEWRVYEKTVEAIRSGNDPAKARMEAVRVEHEKLHEDNVNDRKERLAKHDEESKKRMEDRRKAADARHELIEKRHQEVADKMRKIREEHKASHPPEWA